MTTRILKCITLVALTGALCWAQAGSAPADRSTAYYKYTLAHMYAQLAADGVDRSENVEQAIENYKSAIAADPRSALLAQELSDVYIQFGLTSRGRRDAEEVLRREPNNLAAHRLLARIYLREAGTAQANQLDVNMVRRSIQEYEKITELDPMDVDSWVLLGRLRYAIESNSDAESAFQKALALDPKNVDALTNLAAVYAARDENDKASEMFRRAAETNPSAETLRRLAGSYEELGQFDLAAETIRKALQFNPANAAELRQALAADLLNAGKLEEAVGVYEQVVTDDPDEVEPRLRIAEIYLQSGNLAKAREAMDKARALKPDAIEVRFAEARLLQAEGRPKDAIRAMRDILDATKRPTYTTQQGGARIELLAQLAGMHRMLEQTNEAVAAYREILQLNPERGAGVTAEIIDTYRGGKQFDDAQKEADAAVKKYPNDRVIRVARASLEADLGRVDNAAAEVRKLLDGSSTDYRIYLALVGVYEKGRKFDEAAKALDSAEKLAMDNDAKFEVWFMRGAMYEKMKDIARAEAEFRKALGVSPDNPNVLNYLGYMLADRNQRLPEALELIQKAVSREPANGAFLDSLGWVYYRMGRFSEAEEHIRKAVELSPGDPTMHDHFADVLIERSKTREAIAAWEESLKQWQASSPADRDTTEINKVRSKLEQARTRLAQESRQ
jgi:tetratricopeptide (TPR) repeat protein